MAMGRLKEGGAGEDCGVGSCKSLWVMVKSVGSTLRARGSHGIFEGRVGSGYDFRVLIIPLQSHWLLVGEKRGTTIVENQHLLKMNICLRCDPVFPREKWTQVLPKTRVFSTASFITAPNCKRPKCPQMGESVNTFW